MRAVVYASLAEAQKHASALDACTANQRDGIPLPRCDSGKWGDELIQQGKLCDAECTCKTRGVPEEACPYVTWRAVDVLDIGGGRYAIAITDAHAASKGEVIDVRGEAVVIDDAAARELTSHELSVARGDPPIGDDRVDAPVRTPRSR